MFKCSDAMLCCAFEYLVYALVATHAQKGTINKTDSRAFAQQTLLNEDN